ncbi:MAG TPA: glutamate--tRNA ligase [Acidimicrobiia bacterium]|nr:glutamate--tRNA ligase [Acidimicrobiia bacterium]
MADAPRVRFSPAPTGSLHVGGAHTALFNWLFARHTGGEFALRIEDTDVPRSRPEWVQGIQDALGWLGLDWDDGPMLQSTRFDRYRAAAGRLLAEGRAYECYCTEEEVRARNDAARAAGRAPGYDGHCRDLGPEQRAALAAESRPRSVRFRTPDQGTSAFEDLIRGEISVEWSTIPDFVIVRSDGTPLFFLANAVDDIDMQITHVIRGEDLLDTTHRVLALREALGAIDRPAYAHLPLIVGADRAKLSKRHGAVAVEEFRDSGYLPEAVLNYLALLGWGPEDGREILERDEIVREFDLAGVVHSPAFFDHQKLDWMNGEWIRRVDLDDLERRARPFAEERFGESLDVEAFLGALRIGQERAVTLVSLVEQMDFLFVDEQELVLDPASWERLEKAERAGEILDAVIEHVESCPWNSSEDLDIRPVFEKFGIKPRKAMHVIYTAVEGRAAGLPLFDSMYLLGRDRTLRRLRAARERFGSS